MDPLKWSVLCLCLDFCSSCASFENAVRIHTALISVFLLFPTCSSPASCPESEQQFRGFQCCGLFLVIKASFSGCFSHCGVTTVLEKDFKWLQTATLPLQVSCYLERRIFKERQLTSLVHLHCFPHRQLRVVPGSLSFVLFELSPSLAHSKSRWHGCPRLPRRTQDVREGFYLLAGLKGSYMWTCADRCLLQNEFKQLLFNPSSSCDIRHHWGKDVWGHSWVSDLFSPSEQSPDVVTDVRTEVTEAGAVPVASCHFPSCQRRRAAGWRWVMEVCD